MSNHATKIKLPLTWMVISIFLKYGMVKLLKSLHNVVDVKNTILQIKIFE